MLADLLRTHLQGIKVLGPGEPMISKIRNQFLMSILIKIARGKELAQAKAIIQQNIALIMKEKAHRNVRIITDVDPV
jgi:primosomal protein N' (replication factor Y)